MNGSYVRSESRYFCRSRWKLLGALEIVEADGSLWKLVEVLEVGGLIRKLTKVQETRGSRWKSIYQRLYGSYSNSNRSGCGSFSWRELAEASVGWRKLVQSPVSWRKLVEASCHTKSGTFQVHPWALSCSDSRAGKYTSMGACTNFHGKKITSTEACTNSHGSTFMSMELLAVFQWSVLLSSSTHIHILVGDCTPGYLLGKPCGHRSQV